MQLDRFKYTVLRTASLNRGILPRPKKHVTGMFLPCLRQGRPLRISRPLQLNNLPIPLFCNQKWTCVHTLWVRPQVHGFSHGLTKCPPDTWLHQCAHWCRPFESLIPATKNADTRMGICIFWQRMRDSNPRERSQSPVCYRYTNPLCL